MGDWQVFRQSIRRGGRTLTTFEPLSNQEFAGVPDKRRQRLMFTAISDNLYSPGDLRQEPRPSLGLIDPYFDHAGAGDILITPTNLVR
jgi:hypothetical protein